MYKYNTVYIVGRRKDDKTKCGPLIYADEAGELFTVGDGEHAAQLELNRYYIEQGTSHEYAPSTEFEIKTATLAWLKGSTKLPGNFKNWDELPWSKYDTIPVIDLYDGTITKITHAITSIKTVNSVNGIDFRFNPNLEAYIIKNVDATKRPCPGHYTQSGYQMISK